MFFYVKATLLFCGWIFIAYGLARGVLAMKE